MQDESTSNPEPALNDLRAVLLDEQTVDDILEIVTKLTKRTVPNTMSVSVTLVRNGKPFTSNSSDDVSARLDQAQYDTNVGPCIEAAFSLQVVNDTLEGGRWLTFEPTAMEQGVHSVLATPLKVRDKTLGALNVYGASKSAFPEESVETAALLAEQASVVVANAIAYANAESINKQLREALETRDLIGQAKGILMERQGVSSDHAFDVLRRSSQRTNNKLREVAHELVTKVETRTV